MTPTHPTQSVSERRIYELRLTDEQFRVLWDQFPHDETLIAAACRDAISHVRKPPNRKGVWPKYGVRVYYDEYGWNTSGYLMVHWEDAKRVKGPWLDNGYVSNDPDFRHENMEWDHSEDAKREAYESLMTTLYHWAY